MRKKLRKSDQCPNCGLTLVEMDNYCPECGQHNTTKNVSIRVLVKDFLVDYITFDSRLFKSIGPLLFKPGFLTIEFNKGKRIKYTPPLRLYFIISLIFFLIPSAKEPENKKKSDDAVKISASFSDKEQDNGHTVIGINTENEGPKFNIDVGTLDSNLLDKQEYVDSIAENVLDSMGIDKKSILGKITFRGVKRILGMIGDNGQRFLSDMRRNTPKMMFFLLPVFALLLRLFYIRKKPLYVECLVFSLHFHSFAFIIFSINDLLHLIGVFNDFIDLFMILIVTVYLVLAVKKVFQQKYFISIIKVMGLSGLYLLTLTLALTLTGLITLLA